MKSAQTSDRISELAAEYLNLTEYELLAKTATKEQREDTLKDIQALAGSALRQDEVKGVRKLLKLVTG